MRAKIIRSLATLCTVVTLLAPVHVSAVALLEEACKQPGTKESVACAGTGVAGTNPVVDTLNKVTAFIAVLSGVAAAILLTVAGFMLASANGDASKVETAKKTITYTVIGLVVIMFARLIIGFVIISIYT